MNTPDTTTAERARRWRRSERRAWIAAIATALASLVLGALAPPCWPNGAVTVIAAALVSGLTARAAYRHGQLYVLTKLLPASRRKPR
ncbi:hypothetical protein [Amycolatopsis sp. cg9]|uniref:hypothetical protein n=1 Tax=Amycolatopsis sp. cg9 TaxID=3238801 RepID=UPI0035234DD5